MNTRQISQCLYSDIIVSHYFRGVFPADELANVKKSPYPSCIIANTDGKTKPGSHWVAFFFLSKDECEFFDSFGRPPLIPYFIEFISKLTRYNSQILQHPLSNFCGQWCIYYVYARCRKHGMSDIVKTFDNFTLVENDELVDAFVHGTFCVSGNDLYGAPVVQICRAPRTSEKDFGNALQI